MRVEKLDRDCSPPKSGQKHVQSNMSIAYTFSVLNPGASLGTPGGQWKQLNLWKNLVLYPEEGSIAETSVR